MEFTGVGGGAMLALAAGLWLVYLIPTWLRRREYLATELNAVRLQQTLRVLAETAEVPETIRAETSARSVAIQQSTLREEQRRADAAAHARAAAAARAERGASVEAAVEGTGAALRRATTRLRRTRAVTSLVLLAAIVTLAVQSVLMATTGIAPAAPAVLAFGAVVAVSSIAMLARLAAVSRVRGAAPSAARSTLQKTTSRERAVEVAEAAAATADGPEKSWTPVPVPQPLYLSRSTADLTSVDTSQLVASLRAAAEESELALRAAQTSPEVVPIAQPESAPAGPPSRFAAMGLVDVSESAVPDIDAVLRRRRAAG